MSGRVHLAVPTRADRQRYLDAVTRSADLIGAWNPVEADDAAFTDWLARIERGQLAAYLVVDTAEDALAGVVNLNNLVRRRFQNAALGYNAFVPYAGTGRMTEGLRLVVDRAFASEADGGLGLHRLEISVRPENERSVRLARRLGFRHEGSSPRMLFLDGAWRDHERFAITAEEWPPTGPVPRPG